MNEVTTTLLELTTCDSEPIHSPGSIQPFGVLLAFDANTLTLQNASENSREMFGLGTADPIGSAAANLLGAGAATAIRDALAKDGLIDHRPIPISIPNVEVRHWHGVAHYLNGIVFVELEPTKTVSSPTDMLAAIRSSVGRLSAVANIADFCAVAAREVRSLTRYDRVMVYRFDADWNGEVVAEERRADLAPFLGLHYPASDIPAQARALFLRNRIRVIPDAIHEPIPVIPDLDSFTQLPLDLSRCLLRSASPVHLEYLRNMEVRATLTASLIIDGRLWGLIACHHSTPKWPCPSEREACDLLARLASDRLGLQAEIQEGENLSRFSKALWRVGTSAGATSPPIAALAKNADDLLDLCGANGAIIWSSGRAIPIGQTPPAGALPGLLDWIKWVAAPLIATDQLGKLYAPATHFADVASGLLAVEVSREADEYILWFRPELLQSVNWGGDPHGKSGLDGRLSPRRSFAVWKEIIRNRSSPWRPAEMENAKRVKEILSAAASLSAVRLEGYLPICAWCKKVRDEPGYWRAVEEFVRDFVDVRFTHGICPDCNEEQRAELSARYGKRAGVN